MNLDCSLFERLLSELCQVLTEEARRGDPVDKARTFENRVREVVRDLIGKYGLQVDFSPHPYGFPDIVLSEFGIEVKFTTQDTWRSVANSVLESYRSPDVKHIYLVFGKMGGEPRVAWGRYQDCVIHVRTSHVPRFEVEIDAKESLFAKMGVDYNDFHGLSIEEKMRHIRRYARGRLKEGERLWWLEDLPGQGHSLPLEIRQYMHLEQDEKRKLRAESALLCPEIVKPSRSRGKYEGAAIYLITYHGVMCPQARDLFSAGSVAMRADQKRGGNYVLRALKDIEEEMRHAAMYLEEALFVEYWGEVVPVEKRLGRWLEMADGLARDWKPSDVLFHGE